MITQIPGGILAEKYGGKYVFGIGILLTDFFSLLTPLAARHGGAEAVIALRVFTGLAEVKYVFCILNVQLRARNLKFCFFFLEGVTFPTANSMISKWVPTFERTTIGAFVLAGILPYTVLLSYVFIFIKSHFH